MKASTSLWGIVLSLNVFCMSQAYAEDKFSFDAFVDSYFAYDFNDLNSRKRPYTTQAYIDQEPQINLAYLGSKIEMEDFRARVAFQEGTSVDANYPAEPQPFWQYVQEAVVGVKLAPNLWLDGGVYLSHIGFESWISRDNWNYTRSLIAEYSPYYESGGKLTWQVTDDTSLQFHILNGWQNISHEQHPAFGMQVSHTGFQSLTLTYSNFLGEENFGTRFYNDVSVRYEVNEALSVATVFDVGLQNVKDGQSDAVWFGWTLLAHYQLAPKVALGARVEQFSDPHGIVVTSLGPDHFRTFGLSLNLDIEVMKNLFWRNEVRSYLSNSDIFPDGQGFGRNDTILVTSLAYTFGRAYTPE